MNNLSNIKTDFLLLTEEQQLSIVKNIRILRQIPVSVTNRAETQFKKAHKLVKKLSKAELERLKLEFEDE